MWFATPTVFTFLLVAAIVDLRCRQLPSWLTIGSIVAGFVAAACVGLGTLQLSVLGLLVGGGLLLPFALLGGIGWADVLLLGAVGTWEGGGFVLRAACWTALIGGGLAIAAWRRGQHDFPYVPAIAAGAVVASLIG